MNIVINMSIEQKYFTWQGFDAVGTAVFQFYDCTTVAQIGTHPIGTVFSSITIDYEHSVMRLHKLTSDNDMTTENVTIELLVNNSFH